MDHTAFTLQIHLVAVLEESPCPRGSSGTNLQVLVLVLGPQVFVLVLEPHVLENCQGLCIVQIVRYV